MREFIIDHKEGDGPYRWVITSRNSHYDQDFVFYERMDSEERAIELGKLRHNQGFVVNVYYELAYTIGSKD